MRLLRGTSTGRGPIAPRILERTVALSAPILVREATPDSVRANEVKSERSVGSVLASLFVPQYRGHSGSPVGSGVHLGDCLGRRQQARTGIQRFGHHTLC